MAGVVVTVAICLYGRCYLEYNYLLLAVKTEQAELDFEKIEIVAAVDLFEMVRVTFVPKVADYF